MDTPLGTEPDLKDERRGIAAPLGSAPRAARAIGALALFVVGGDHLQQYAAAYFSAIPTIGTLFLVNFVAASVFGLVLLVPLRSTAGVRRLTVDTVVAVAAVGLAIGAFAGLLISEQTPLFGFMEHGYRLAIVIALAAEGVTALSLTVFLAYAHKRLRGLRDGAGRSQKAGTAPGAASAAGSGP